MDDQKRPLLGGNEKNHHDLSNSDIENPDQKVVEYKPGDSRLEDLFGTKMGPASYVTNYLTVADYARLQSCSKTLNKALKNVPEQNEITSAQSELTQAKYSSRKAIFKLAISTIAFPSFWVLAAKRAAETHENLNDINNTIAELCNQSKELSCPPTPLCDIEDAQWHNRTLESINTTNLCQGAVLNVTCSILSDCLSQSEEQYNNQVIIQSFLLVSLTMLSGLAGYTLFKNLYLRYKSQSQGASEATQRLNTLTNEVKGRPATAFPSSDNHADHTLDEKEQKTSEETNGPRL